MSNATKLLIIIPVLLGAYLIFTICGLFPNLLVKQGHIFYANLLTLLVIPLTIIFVWFLNSKINQISLSSITGPARTFYKPLLFGTGLGILIFAFTLVCLFFTSEFAFSINTTLQVRAVIAILLTNAIIAFFEEFIFRGFIFTTIRNVTSKTWIAMVLSSLIFTVVHFQKFTGNSWVFLFLFLFFGGILFCILLLRFKSIWAPIGTHFIVNALNGTDLFYLNNKFDLVDQQSTVLALQFQTIIVVILVVIFAIFWRPYLLINRSPA